MLQPKRHLCAQIFGKSLLLLLLLLVESRHTLFLILRCTSTGTGVFCPLSRVGASSAQELKYKYIS